MLARALKERLATGGVVLGTWLTIAHVSIAEILASSGYDFVVIDTEHTAITWSEVLRLNVAVEGRQCVPIVRLSSVDPVQAKIALDSGAAGILVPMVTTLAEAQTAVASTKYPPAGRRGAAIARAHDYGPGFADYLRDANSGTLVILQIEHVDALAELDNILSVPGIDATIIGPYDLSASLGHAGELDHPDVVAAMERIVRTSVAHGLAPGIHIVRPEQAESELAQRLAEGYRFIALATDALFLGHASRRLGSAAHASLREHPHG